MIVFVVIAAVAVPLWGSVYLARTGLLGCALLVLLAGCCFDSYFLEIPMRPMPLTLGRLLWGVMLIQYVVWRRLGLAEPKAISRTDWVLIAFLGWITVSALTHSGSVSPLPRLVLFYVLPAGMYWVARETALSRRAQEITWIALAAFGLYLSVTAFAETRQAWWMVFPRYVGSTEYWEFLGRGRGPMLNPVANGLAITLGMICAAMLFPRLSRSGRCLLAVLFPLYLLGCYFTLTRCVWLGAAGSLAVIVWLTIPRSKSVPLLAACGLAALLVMATQWQHFTTFKRDRHLTAQDAANSVHLRPILALVAWNMFKEQPLTGVGLARYDENSKYYLTDRNAPLPLEQARPYTQHNVFLSLLTETGLIGLALFTTMLLLWCYCGWRLWQNGQVPLWARQQGLVMGAFVVAYVANGMFQDVSQIIMVNMLLFFEAGICMNLYLNSKYQLERQAT